MAQNNATDDRTDNQKIKMAKWFSEERAEYEDADGFTIVYEDDECVIIADHSGHEINEWASRFDADREELRSTFRALADQKMGEKDAHEAFSYSDPVVFDKFEDS
ncbi:hypothetical protein [Natrarchaeobius oligotrophus]|uniref:Uncharacterized protein n=1 Tax=Natrarchaeobius chitinivorans TaxID=1679083 RepID=A0A3N6MI58_NATCH|nr:hypothetical protein [Natrarchaeobius chitinivorans]RQG93716.1 hypothetical protein EA472_22535 [Natrarchaeobius chitinivorans]